MGTHNVTASYPGDSSFNSSGASTPVTVTITKGNPILTINAQATEPGAVPVSIGANLGTGLGTILPTGTMQFFDGGTALGSPVPVVSGGATEQVTFNSSGQHNISAQYSGDATYNSAVVSALAVNVVAPFTFGFVNGVNSATVQAGGTANFNLVLSQFAGTSFTGTVSFTCTGAPAGTTCTTTPNGGNLSNLGIPVAVSVATTTSARLGHNPFRTWSPFFAAVVGILVCGAGRKRKSAIMMLLALALIVGMGGCGGGGGPIVRPPTVATLTITATSGSFSSNANLVLTITH